MKTIQELLIAVIGEAHIEISPQATTPAAAVMRIVRNYANVLYQDKFHIDRGFKIDKNISGPVELEIRHPDFMDLKVRTILSYPRPDKVFNYHAYAVKKPIGGFRGIEQEKHFKREAIRKANLLKTSLESYITRI